MTEPCGALVRAIGGHDYPCQQPAGHEGPHGDQPEATRKRPDRGSAARRCLDCDWWEHAGSSRVTEPGVCPECGGSNLRPLLPSGSGARPFDSPGPLDPVEQPPERLVTFLYLLMRDRVPTGKVAAALEDACSLSPGAYYSSDELAALARRYAGQLVERPRP